MNREATTRDREEGLGAQAMGSADRVLAFDRGLRSIVGPILLGFLLLGLWSAFALRGLFADGAWYFLQLLAHDVPHIVEPARRTVQLLQQGPTLLALDLGLLDLRGLIVLFGATTHLLPLLLLALCWLVLPRDRKALFAFPVLHFLVGTQAAGLAAIVEGPIAAGYFWFLLLLISFRTDGIAGQLAAIILALPALYLHEGLALLAPVLAGAAFLRVREHRPLLWLLAVWFLVVAVVQAGFILNPRSAEMRHVFIRSILLAKSIYEPSTFSVPAILGFVAVIGLPILVLPKRSERGIWFLIAAFAALSLALVLSAMLTDVMFSPISQFHARSDGLLLSLPLGLLFLLALRRPALRTYWERPPIVGLIAILAAGQMACQAIETRYWSEFIASFEMALARNRGLVTWADAMASLPADQAKSLERMAWAWTNPTMSLLLAPEGKVSTVIGTIGSGWAPFDPAKPDELPRSPFIDTTPYRKILAH